VPGSKGAWLMVKDSVKIDRPADAPYPAGLKAAHIVHEEAPAGMVEAAAVHELPPLPSAEEVAAGVAETDAHVAEAARDDSQEG